jgi:hypothetical protein
MDALQDSNWGQETKNRIRQEHGVDLTYRESNGSFYNEQKYVNTQQNSHELKKADVDSS